VIWLKGIVGVILALLGLLWIGQGIGLIPGSFMTGQILWAIIGLIVLIVGAWLIWSAFGSGRPAGTGTRS
jgi:hypothetical protein